MDEIEELSPVTASARLATPPGQGAGLLPVLIGGCDRSGTTLLGAMLGAHSQAVCTPESQFVVEVFGRSQPASSSLLAEISRHPRFKLWGIDVASRDRDQFRQTAYPALVGLLVKRYALKIGKPSPTYWVDHTPSNVKYAAALFSLFPGARLVHIVRDGRAVAASLLKLRWGPSSVDKAAYFWLRNLSYGLAAEAHFGPGRVSRVRYEDLISAPEATLQRLCSFLGWDYQPRMLGGSGFAPPAYTRRQHSLVGGKPDPARIHAWAEELSPRQVEIFEAIAGDMLAYLGFAPQFGISAREMTASERLAFKLKSVLMYAGNLSRQLELWWYARRISDK
jgi:hypothetical protein